MGNSNSNRTPLPSTTATELKLSYSCLSPLEKLVVANSLQSEVLREVCEVKLRENFKLPSERKRELKVPSPSRACGTPWKDRDGHRLQSFAIVTTEANELMSRIHTRMLAILHSCDYDGWLDREETGRLRLDLLLPYESDEMGSVRSQSQSQLRAEQWPRDDASRGADQHPAIRLRHLGWRCHLRRGFKI